MDRVAVLADDPSHFRETLQPLLERQQAPRQWIVVACAPRVTNRMSKWVSRSTREHWRRKWADKLFTEVLPWLQAHGDPHVEQTIADGPIDDVIHKLGNIHVIDARRPKMSAVPQARQQFGRALQAIPMVLAGLGAALTLMVDPV